MLAVTPSAGLPSSCHFASDKDNDGGTNLSGYPRLGSHAAFGVCRVSLLPCLVCLTEIVMRHIRHYSRATRRWHSLVGVRWQRLQSHISGAYFQRVTQPLQFWHALGRPSQFRPSLPWWQPFVWRWLVVTGWVRPSRRRERPV